MKKTNKVFAGFLACLSFCACGSQNYNGTYSGSCTGCPSTSLSMTLYQQGNNVTGDWVSGAVGGTFSATADGSSLNSASFTPLSGAATAQGTLSLSGSTLSGASGAYNVSLTQTQ